MQEKPFLETNDIAFVAIRPILKMNFTLFVFARRLETLYKNTFKACYYKRPSMYKYLSLLQTNNKTELINICLYVKESLKVRTSILNARML